VKRSVDFPAWLIVTCPREDCGEAFLVKAAPWRKQKKRVSRTGRMNQEYVVTGRVCPYCFAASLLPRRIPR
jgi:hypothetical protein